MTPQRIALTALLDRSEGRPVTAEFLYSDVLKAHFRVSRATVTHALRQFEQAGLLRRIAIRGSKKAWFVMDHPIAPRELRAREDKQSRVV